MSSDRPQAALREAQETLDTLLGYLGFVVSISADPDSRTLHVFSSDGNLLIGRNGERLEDITHLLNCLLRVRSPGFPHVQIDIEGYLAARDERLIATARVAAAQVLATGRAIELEPLNSYQRHLIHDHFKDHPGLLTSSPSGNARWKRVTLSPRYPSARGPARPS